MSEDGSALDTLLVGVDGACASVLEPLFEADRLPHLQSLFDEGVAGSLTAQLPPWSPSAWPSLYTGVNPGGHGAFGDDTETPADRTRVREHALWELVGQTGRRSVVVNVPLTDPPPTFDGALVPGESGSAEPRCHPDGLLSTLQSELGAYRVTKPTGLDRDGRVEWYERLTRMRGRAFRYLADRMDPDFGFLQFRQTDTVFHELPEDRDAVRSVFEAVDEEIGRVLAACDPETVLVVSAHGIGPCEGPTFHVNEFLRDLDLLRTTREAGGRSSVGRPSVDAGSHTVFRAFVDRVGRTGERFGSVLERLGLGGIVGDRASADPDATSERVDRADSVAYMRSPREMGVRINVAGRDEGGLVSPAEYAVVRDDVIDELAAVTTPDGDPVFDDVRAVETVFHGPHADAAVDILTVPAGFDVTLSAALGGEQFSETPERWDHKREGVIAAAGEGVDTDAALGNAHLLDVAPTVLSLLDVSPSVRMDGRVLPFADAVDTESYPPFHPLDPDEGPSRPVADHPVDTRHPGDRGER